MQDVPPVALQPTEVIPAKRFLSVKKSVICDVRMEEFTLKKLTALFLALLMLVSMCACAAPASTEDDAYQAKVALCLVTPVNDGAWSQLAYDAVMKAKDTYNISVKYTENIKPTEMEAVFTDYASQGYDLIIGHSFSFGDAALAVAERYPDTKFIVIDGTVSSENVASYTLKMQEVGYLEGIAAGMMTKTNKVGFVAGLVGPAIIKVAEGYKLGVQAVNPNCDVYTAYTGSTEDVQKSKEAAQAMIDKGVDLIGGGGNASNAGMIKACEEAGVYAFGELEQQNLAPETVIFCNMNNIENLVLQAVKDTIDGDFQGCIREYGISADVAQLTEYNSHVPQEVKDKLAECMDQMRSGELDIPMITEISDDIIH